MLDTGVVHCEKLLAVIDPTVPSWWLRTLEVTDEAIFAGGGRLEDVAEAAAIEAAVTARRRGFHPILLCASPATRQRLGDAFAQRGRSGHFLVQGRDDERIRGLLLHPSRDVLLGWLGRKKLVVPTRAYYNALQGWLAHDALYQAFQQSLEQRDIHLSDFQLVVEPEVASEAPRQTYELQWKLDPSRKLELFLYLDTHEAILAHSVAGEPVSDVVKMDSYVLRFDSSGECMLDGSILAWLVDQFDLPESYRYWDDIDWSPSLLDQIVQSVQEWWHGTSTVFSKFLTPERWNLLAPLLEHDLAGASVRTVTPTTSQRSPAEPAQLHKPVLRMVDDEPDLQFEVQWRTLSAEAIASLAQEPQVQVVVLEERVEPGISWDQDYRRLTIRDIRLPRPYRYGYAWDAINNTLRIRIIN